MFKLSRFNHFFGGRIAPLSLLLLPLMTHAAETATTATITVKGKVVGNTCEMLAGQIIDFGSVNRTQFTSNLYQKPDVNVVTLSKCGSAADSVKVTVSDYGLNQDKGTDAATGVSVQLYNGNKLLAKDAKSEAIRLVGAGESKQLKLTPALRIDPNTFKEGTVNASISVNIEYM